MIWMSSFLSSIVVTDDDADDKDDDDDENDDEGGFHDPGCFPLFVEWDPAKVKPENI